jgi:hypothetical protein
MGYIKEKKTKSFTKNDVDDKELIISMLQSEEKLIRSDYGQSRYRNAYNHPYKSLTNEYAFNRMVLNEFGYDTSDESVEMYRTIFRTYFNSPDDYDKDVINAVHYMRNNKCVFYTASDINIGDDLPDCDLYQLDGTTVTTLHTIINKNKPFESTFIAAFSLS